MGEDNFESLFLECEDSYKELFKEASEFWVLPFTKPDYFAKGLMEQFRRCGKDRYLVHVGNKMKSHSNIKEKVIFRIDTPICTGSDLLKFIRHEVS